METWLVKERGKGACYLLLAIHWLSTQFQAPFMSIITHAHINIAS